VELAHSLALYHGQVGGDDASQIGLLRLVVCSGCNAVLCTLTVGIFAVTWDEIEIDVVGIAEVEGCNILGNGLTRNGEP